MGYQACGHQRLQVAVSDSLMTQMCVISLLDLQIAVSDSLMTQICVKSSLEGNEWLDTNMSQIKIRYCNFLILTHFCVILNPSMQFLWRLKNGLMAPPRVELVRGCQRSEPLIHEVPYLNDVRIGLKDKSVYW